MFAYVSYHTILFYLSGEDNRIPFFTDYKKRLLSLDNVVIHMTMYRIFPKARIDDLLVVRSTKLGILIRLLSIGGTFRCIFYVKNIKNKNRKRI